MVELLTNKTPGVVHPQNKEKRRYELIVASYDGRLLLVTAAAALRNLYEEVRRIVTRKGEFIVRDSLKGEILSKDKVLTILKL